MATRAVVPRPFSTPSAMITPTASQTRARGTTTPATKSVLTPGSPACRKEVKKKSAGASPQALSTEKAV